MPAIICTRPASPAPHETALAPTEHPAKTTSCTACAGQTFAIASIRGQVCLVQGILGRAPALVEVDVFRHEFISMFRWSYYAALHPSDIRVLETIDEECIRYEEESGTVFMSRDAIARLSKWLNRGVPRPRPSQVQRKRW